MNEVIVENIIIVSLVLFPLLGVLIKLALPWLKSQEALNTADKRNAWLDNVYAWVELGVKAAEQKFKDIPKSGNAKKKFVIEHLQGLGFKLTDSQLDVFIEAAVKELQMLEFEFRK